MPHFAMIALLVDDYDKAIDWYCTKLGFRLHEDTDRGNGKRWVIIGPRGEQETKLLLAKATTEEQTSRVGNQTGGRVFLFLYTDDFWSDYNHMKAQGVQFIDQPREEEYGTVIVFEDLYGNKWDFIEPR